MPIYEYQCQACGEEFEEWQKISDPALKKCPKCGKMKLQKLISPVGFRLKGGGWYETDFKKSGKRNLAGDGKSEKKPAAGKAETKADKKPVEKKASKDAGAAA